MKKFTVEGWLTTTSVTASLNRSHLKALKSPGVMVGDEIVTMLMLYAINLGQNDI